MLLVYCTTLTVKHFCLEIFDLTDTKETVIELSNMVENYKNLALEKHGTHNYA